MKIVNDALTESMRQFGPCRHCGRRVNLCGAHVFAKGHGAGRQIDIPCNLVSLGMPLTCNCHGSHHDGNEPTFEQLLAYSAADHDCLQGDIEALRDLILRMPKWNSMNPERYLAICDRELNYSARRLARTQLESFKHLWDELRRPRQSHPQKAIRTRPERS